VNIPGGQGFDPPKEEGFSARENQGAQGKGRKDPFPHLYAGGKTFKNDPLPLFPEVAMYPGIGKSMFLPPVVSLASRGVAERPLPEGRVYRAREEEVRVRGYCFGARERKMVHESRREEDERRKLGTKRKTPADLLTFPVVDLPFG
jgi:hypothetical protein